MTSIEMCLNCTKNKCSGTCALIKKAEREEDRRQYRTLTVNGETRTLTEWAKITGLSYNLIETRIRRGKKGHEVIKPKRRTDNGQLHTNSGTKSNS